MRSHPLPNNNHEDIFLIQPLHRQAWNKHPFDWGYLWCVIIWCTVILTCGSGPSIAACATEQHCSSAAEFLQRGASSAPGRGPALQSWRWAEWASAAPGRPCPATTPPAGEKGLLINTPHKLNQPVTTWGLALTQFLLVLALWSSFCCRTWPMPSLKLLTFSTVASYSCSVANGRTEEKNPSRMSAPYGPPLTTQKALLTTENISAVNPLWNWSSA